MSATQPIPFDPPGYVVGIIWSFLFAGMAIARWLVLRPAREQATSATWIFALIFLCAAYPIYTLALTNEVFEIGGNIMTIGFSLLVAYRIRQDSPLAVLLVLAVAGWVSFATFLTVEELRQPFA